jgi:hypothetical protein
VGDRTHMLVDAAGRLPEAVPREGESTWAAAIRDARERGAIDAELVGWVGDRRAGLGQSALSLRSAIREDSRLVAGNRFAPVKELLAGQDERLVRTALHYQDQFES